MAGKRILDEDSVLKARLRDIMRLAESERKPGFVGFLDERQAAAAHSFMESLEASGYLFWGGYEGAERVMLGVFPGFQEPGAELFPISGITASYRDKDVLTHRDFLGALLNLGIVRETLGDILIEEGRCVFFCRSEISDFLLSQTEKIGGVGVRLSPGAERPFPALHRFREFTAVVASARLDCVVAAAVGTSREKAAEKIRSGLVMLNHKAVCSPSAAVIEGNRVSIRGTGRFILDAVGPVTKKGRLRIAGRKYI